MRFQVWQSKVFEYVAFAGGRVNVNAASTEPRAVRLEVFAEPIRGRRDDEIVLLPASSHYQSIPPTNQVGGENVNRDAEGHVHAQFVFWSPGR